MRDATSGFFAVRKSVLEGVSLNALGFKIGLEVFVKSRHEGRISEIPFVFKDRQKGTSKLGARVIGHYFRHLWMLYRLSWFTV